ncbi:MAG: class I SAM-dependent rRNA methyltransferase [Acidobacteria bacterium]|nr:class I SAM-dependent rRNA methyltransferase [Acidobacteriota bacterium]
MATAILKRGRDLRIRLGHLWVYEGEIDRVEGNPEPGAIVRVRDAHRRFLATGYYNARSKIRIRLLTRDRETHIQRSFLESRLREAIEFRKRIYPEEEAVRLVYAEGDYLPGLIVDRYGSHLGVQVTTAGMDRLRDDVIGILESCLHPAGIYEKSDSASRRHEGVPPRTGWLRGESPGPIPVTQDGLRFFVDLERDQKTGLYLDHRENRRALRPFVAGAEVLDMFCNAGSFGLYALRFGAGRVLGVDSSAECLERARQCAEANGFGDRMEFREGNGFDLLREFDQEGRRFDAVFLDPPSFTKSSGSVDNAARGYKEINLRAFRIVRPGGIVVTSSCSYHVTLPLFLEILRDAAADARRIPRVVAVGGQAPDHPVNLGVPETSYLKCVFLQVP